MPMGSHWTQRLSWLPWLWWWGFTIDRNWNSSHSVNECAHCVCKIFKYEDCDLTHHIRVSQCPKVGGRRWHWAQHDYLIPWPFRPYEGEWSDGEEANPDKYGVRFRYLSAINRGVGKTNNAYILYLYIADKQTNLWSWAALFDLPWE